MQHFYFVHTNMGFSNIIRLGLQVLIKRVNVSIFLFFLNRKTYMLEMLRFQKEKKDVGSL